MAIRQARSALRRRHRDAPGPYRLDVCCRSARPDRTWRGSSRTPRRCWNCSFRLISSSARATPHPVASGSSGVPRRRSFTSRPRTGVFPEDIEQPDRELVEKATHHPQPEPTKRIEGPRIRLPNAAMLAGDSAIRADEAANVAAVLRSTGSFRSAWHLPRLHLQGPGSRSRRRSGQGGREDVTVRRRQPPD